MNNITESIFKKSKKNTANESSKVSKLVHDFKNRLQVTKILINLINEQIISGEKIDTETKNDMNKSLILLKDIWEELQLKIN